MTSDIRDPVCGMQVNPGSSLHTFEYDGTTYLFCCDGCRAAFQSNPEKFLGHANRSESLPPTRHHDQISAKSLEASVSGNTVYLCPMCPEVREDEAVPCPSCGMALEREILTDALTRLEYTCPMHPEVVQGEPYTCPLCGMGLEPRTVTLEDPQRSVYRCSRWR